MSHPPGLRPRVPDLQDVGQYAVLADATARVVHHAASVAEVDVADAGGTEHHVKVAHIGMKPAAEGARDSLGERGIIVWPAVVDRPSKRGIDPKKPRSLWRALRGFVRGRPRAGYLSPISVLFSVGPGGEGSPVLAEVARAVKERGAEPGFEPPDPIVLSGGVQVWPHGDGGFRIQAADGSRLEVTLPRPTGNKAEEAVWTVEVKGRASMVVRNGDCETVVRRGRWRVEDQAGRGGEFQTRGVLLVAASGEDGQPVLLSGYHDGMVAPHTHPGVQSGSSSTGPAVFPPLVPGEHSAKHLKAR